MSTLNAVPFRSTIFYTAAGVPASAGSVLTVGTNGVPGFTTNLGSTTVSLGASTNQTYNSFTNGLYASTLWGSTLTGLNSIQKVSMSYSGQYQLAVQNSSTINSSRNSGFSWSSLTGAAGLPAGATAYPQATASGVPAYTSISASANGQYILASVNGGLLYTCANGTSASPTFTAAGMGTPTYYMPFEGSTADVIGTASPAANPTPTGSMAYVTGAVGTQALNLVNTAGSSGNTATNYIRYTVPTNMTSFTISGWFNSRSLATTGYPTILSMYSQALVLFINSSTLYLNYPTGTGSGQASILTAGISLNTWYSFTIIYQIGTVSLYVNNVLIGTGASTGLGTFTGSTLGLACYDSSTAQPFNGYIDDLRIYNTAVTFSPIVPMNWSQTAVSGTGQYMLAAVASGGLFQSSNYGATWSQVTATTGLWTGLAISYSGQYMLTSGGVAIIPNQSSLATSTWTQNGVIWGSLASSFNSPTYPAYKAFNTTTGDGWLCDNVTQRYTNGSPNGNAASTTIQTIGATAGEWLQIQSSIPLVMTSFALGLGPNPSNATNTPKTYYIVGSNDGTTWFPLQNGNITFSSFAALSSYININTTGTQTLAGNMVGSVVTTAYSYSTNAYTFFRLICTTLTYASGASTYAEVGEWALNFVGGQSYSTNYGGAWTTATTGLYTNAIAVSGSGQYTFGANNNTLPSCYLTLDGTFVDSFGGLTAPTITGSVPFSSSIFKTGSSSPLFSNTAGSSTTTNYITYTVPSFLGNPATLSVSFWIYPLAWPASNVATPFAFSNSANTTEGPYFQLLTDGTIRLYIYTTSSPAGLSILSTATAPINTWTHIAFTYTSGTAMLYMNGTLQGTVSISGVICINGATTTPLSRVNLGIFRPGLFAYNGYVDDVRIYTTTLSPTFLYAIYANPSMVYLNTIGSNYLTSVTTPSYGGVSGISAAISAAVMSYSGQYIVVLTQGTTNNVYYSTNYGATFAALTLGAAAMTSCAISTDGTYITVSNATTVYTLNRNTQGFSVTLGNAAGMVNQGQNTIAIGNQAGVTNQSANSIILNSSGSALDAYTSGFYVSNIAEYGTSYASSVSLLAYGSDSQILKGPTVSILMAGSAGTVPQAYCTQHTKSILANNFQQFEWTHLQSNNSYGYGPASVPFVVKIATLGASSNNNSYGIINIRGQAGGWINSNTMFFDINVISRGAFQISGTITGPYAATVATVDLVYVLNSSSQYDIYLYSKQATYIVYDVTVSGNTGSNTLYDPSVAVATSTIPSGITSITVSANLFQNGGNLGIGTTAPAYPLHVNGSLNCSSLLVNGTAVATGTGSVWTVNGSAAYYTSGFVGIGTTNPLSTQFTMPGGAGNGLDIFGSTAFDASCNLRLYNNASQYGRTILQLISRYENSNDGWSLNGGRNNIQFGYQTSQGSAITYANTIQSFAGQMGFFSNGYSTTNPAMVINSSGNVGIGTTLPVGQLHVFSGTGTLPILTAWNNQWSVFGGGGTTASAVGIGFCTSASTYWGAGGQLISVTPSSAFSSMNYYALSHLFYCNTDGAGAAKVVINSSGSVGIGTTTVRRTLDVVGTPSFPFTYAPTQLSLSDTAGSALMNLLIGVSGTSNYASIQSSLSGTGPMPLLLNASGGSVGIGTSSPVTLLHIAKSVSTGADYSLMLYYENTYPAYHDWAIGPYIDSNAAAFAVRSAANNTPANLINLFYIDGYGTALRFPQYTTSGTLSINGTGGAISSSSDRRIKQDIVYQTDTADALARVLQLRPATFRFLEQESLHLGFIAQDVEQCIPLAVDGKKYEWQWKPTENGAPTFDADGNMIYQTDSYGNRIIRPRGLEDRAILATHTLAIQELASENAALKAQVASLLVWAQTQGFSS